MFRKSLMAAAAFLSAEVSHAQVNDITTGLPDSSIWTAWPAYERPISAEAAQRNADIERKYRETVAKIPNRRPSNDPWKSVRQAPAATTPDRHRVE